MSKQYPDRPQTCFCVVNTLDLYQNFSESEFTHEQAEALAEVFRQFFSYDIDDRPVPVDVLGLIQKLTEAKFTVEQATTLVESMDRIMVAHDKKTVEPRFRRQPSC